MNIYCPYCDLNFESTKNCPRIVRCGHFYRKSDSKRIQRFHCLNCARRFSRATFHPCFRQKKRQKNETLKRMLCSGVSQRRAAKILGLNRKTIVRKFKHLAVQAKLWLMIENSLKPKAEIVEFDDLETFEHTKCKPLSVTLAVEHGSRRILGFAVSQMPAKGHLARIAYKKYGFRKDFRAQGRAELFSNIKPLIADRAVLKSDSNPHYPQDVKRFLPDCSHITFLGQRGSITGQGELKKIRFDPLFSLNHTCAKFRADVNRLVRKTWCTTKDPARLVDHLSIYACFHNRNFAGP